MDRQHLHADWTLLPWRQLPNTCRPNVHLGAEIELTSTLVKLLFYTPALNLMLLPVSVLAFLVAIPNAHAIPTLHEGITLLAARRTQLGRGCRIFHVGFDFIVILSFCRCAERHGAELLGSCRVLFS